MKSTEDEKKNPLGFESETTLVEELLYKFDEGDPGALGAFFQHHSEQANLFDRVRRLYGLLVDAVQTLESPEANRSSSSQLDGLSTIEIPGYELRREIGRGGMGVVFEALELATRRRVALKVIQVRDGHATQERFHREISALGMLTSPHVVTLYSSGALGGIFYYSMELRSLGHV